MKRRWNELSRGWKAFGVATMLAVLVGCVFGLTKTILAGNEDVHIALVYFQADPCSQQDTVTLLYGWEGTDGMDNKVWQLDERAIGGSTWKNVDYGSNPNNTWYTDPAVEYEFPGASASEWSSTGYEIRFKVWDNNEVFGEEIITVHPWDNTNGSWTLEVNVGPGAMGCDHNYPSGHKDTWPVACDWEKPSGKGATLLFPQAYGELDISTASGSGITNATPADVTTPCDDGTCPNCPTSTGGYIYLMIDCNDDGTGDYPMARDYWSDTHTDD